MYAHGPLRHCHGTSEFSMISDLDRQRGEAMLQTEGTHADSQKLMGEYDARSQTVTLMPQDLRLGLLGSRSENACLRKENCQQ
jgi:hypothetical protein